MRAITSLLIAGVGMASVCQAAIVTKHVDYKQGNTVLEGYLAYDDAKTGPLPGVLIVHDWNGTDEYEEGRARMLAELGYVAFSADIYGKGVRPQNAQESGAEAGKYRQDNALFRARLQAGLDTLKAQPMVDKSKTAAMGYCFGGGGVLELARSGADVKGVVSFHGNLNTPNLDDAKNIKCKVLLEHAIDDPSTSKEQLLTFFKEMKDAKVDYRLVTHPLAVHAFTVKGGGQYDATADARSWDDMKRFFIEIFGQ